MLNSPEGPLIQDYKISDEVITSETAAMQVKIYDAYGLRLLGKSVSSVGLHLSKMQGLIRLWSRTMG